MDEKNRTFEDLLAEITYLRGELAQVKAHGASKEENGSFSEEDYRAIFDAANDAIFIHDIKTGDIIDVNQKATEMFCFPKDEIVKSKIQDISAGHLPYTQEDAMRFINRAADGQPQIFEWLAKDKAHRLFWVEVNLKRAVIHGKYCLLAIVRDISERKEEEKIIELAHFSIEHAADSIFWIAPNANILYVNEMTCRALGYSRDELLNMTVHDIDPDYTFSVWPSHWKELKERKSFTFESRHKRKDGTIFPVEITVNYLEFQGEEYNFAFAKDITERKKIEAEVRQSQERYNIVAKATNDAIWDWDLVTNETVWSDAIESLFGYPLEVDMTKPQWWTDKIHPEDRERVSSSIFDSIKNGKDIWSSEYRFLRKDGSYAYIFDRGFIIRDENSSAVRMIGSMMDITERKRQEEAIVMRSEQLEIVSRTSQHINAVLEISVILRTLVAAAIELVDAGGGMAGLLHDGRMVFREYNNEGALEKIDFSFELEKGVMGSISKTCKPYVSNDAAKDENISDEKKRRFNVRSIISIPIQDRNGSLMGCLELYNKHSQQQFSTQDVFMLQGLAASASVALQNATILAELKEAEIEREALNKELLKTNKKLNQLALKDSQTGLYNFRYFNEFIEAELYRSMRYGHPLSLVMIDVDYFRSVNDLYGHEFGDAVIRQVATFFKKVVRRYDILVRYSGAEFVIISPGINRLRATMLGQRLLDAVNIYTFGDKNRPVKLKISVAVASYPDDKITRGSDLMSIADKILSKVKEDGGNRIYSSLDFKKKKPAIKEKLPEPSDIRLLREKIERLNKRSKQSLIESIFAFARTIELRDKYTGDHAEQTVHFATETAKDLGLHLDEIENIRQASVLHDLGKIGITDKILLKKSKLTKKEFDEIKKHPQIAADIIRPVQFMHDIVPLVLYHHERWDGRGYPAGLKGEEIPVGARIIAVADVYQALMSNRPYHKAYTKKAAIDIMKKESGKQFDPEVLDAFLKVLEDEENNAKPTRGKRISSQEAGKAR